MSIKVKIFHAKILQVIHKPDAIVVRGQTAGECLNDLISKYPDIKELIFNQQHQLLDEVYVFVNAESLHKVELSNPVKDGDTLIIAALIMGG